MIEDKIEKYLTEKIYNTDDYERFNKWIVDKIHYRGQTVTCCYTCYHFFDDELGRQVCENPIVEKILDDNDVDKNFEVDYLGICKNYKKG